MGIAVVERNALLEQVWDLQTVRDYVAIADLLGELPLEEHLREPELGVILCTAWYQLGAYNNAIELTQKLTPVCEYRGNTRLARRRMNTEALLRIVRGELDIAESLLQKLLYRVEEAGDLQFTTWTHNNLGILYCTKGLWDFALSHYRRAMVAGQRFGQVRHISLCHLNISVAYLRMNRIFDAREHVLQAIELSRDNGSDAELAHIESTQASILLEHRDYLLARITANQSGLRFSRINSKMGAAMTSHLHGRISIAEGHIPEARAHLEDAFAAYADSGYSADDGYLMESFASLNAAEGNSAAAIAYFNKALLFFSELGNAFEVDRLHKKVLDQHSNFY